VAGVDGNGQTEMGQALVGLRSVVSGTIKSEGRSLTNCSPAEIIDAGIGFVSSDRQVWGLFPDLSVAENLISDEHSHPPFSRRGFLQPRAIAAATEDMVRSFDIRPPDPNLRASALSGGNKQKIVIARAFSRKPRILIVNQPTRGVDVGASEYIRKRLLDERARGAAILLISADLDEILTLSDRIAVMYEGRFMAVIPAEEATADRVGLLMAGVCQPAASTD
jgi:ABC-type uncharacterized transport system ATPase subunit